MSGRSKKRSLADILHRALLHRDFNGRVDLNESSDNSSPLAEMDASN